MRNFIRSLLHRRLSPRTKPPTNQNRVMSGTGGIAAALYACTVSPPAALGAVPEDSEERTHHLKNGRFANPWDSWKTVSGPQIGMAMMYRKFTGDWNTPDVTPPTVPVRKPDFLPTRTASTSLRATWLGHACYYVEFPSGLRVLFDPVFEDRCSPFSWLGPKRYTEPPCHVKDLPIVDVVVISHSHYDHLSHTSVVDLHKSHPEAQFMVGLGLKKWFEECGIKNVVEMDWWNDVDLTLSPRTGEKRISNASTQSSIPKSTQSDITARISCLPCQHTSARSAFDQNTTLWCSWAVTSGGKSVWFGGDTGYRAVPRLPKGVDDYGEEYKDLPQCPAFKQIGDLRGPFDLGLIPIGAYDPRDIMSSMHANPFDSVNIFIDTKCKRAMGIHWGTWVLTTEDVLEPPQLLKKAMAWKSLPETGVFDVCDIGESRDF
ncbi:N-acyl-phosphatidylethanolamine-hydrolyzing phospholipase D [Phlyctema vagabunda]|uniref:N-acyl-phosphatidylethanolamine-hydrolyzing phospholipase D n=1 Tax=Phlyctema vagabunda TaxID=108571 RepID=A0ABR4PBT9_9HELO